MKRLELVYAGAMEMTDFRETAERFATAHGLTGYVRKFPNGTVKILAEGDEKELKKFMRDFNEDMDIWIDKFSQHWFPATGEYSKFRFLNI